MRAGERIMEAKECSIGIPVFITHGTADTMTSHEASQGFVEKLQCPDKTFQSYDGGYHSRKSIILVAHFECNNLWLSSLRHQQGNSYQ